MGGDARFRDRSVVLNGVPGEDIEIPSANPVNYYQAINEPDECETIILDGKLFLPSADQPLPLVLLVPGSLGVADSHISHAEVLLAEGYAVAVLDPFGARSIQSTVANQTSYSFAASAFDVLASLLVFSDHPAIDSDRISAQGHSRGGSAVITAAMRSFANRIVGDRAALAGVYGVYPWCGHQFVTPEVGATRVRVIVGDRDDWLSVQQVQAQVQAIRLVGGYASLRIVAGAGHSFDRREAVHEVPDASVAPGAPTLYLDSDGAMINFDTGLTDSALTDRDIFLAAVDAGLGRRGAHIGSVGDQPDLFRADMLAFHASVFHS